jgi:hypothetical protein
MEVHMRNEVILTNINATSIFEKYTQYCQLCSVSSGARDAKEDVFAYIRAYVTIRANAPSPEHIGLTLDCTQKEVQITLVRPGTNEFSVHLEPGNYTVNGTDMPVAIHRWETVSVTAIVIDALIFRTYKR